MSQRREHRLRDEAKHVHWGVSSDWTLQLQDSEINLK
jgi:hypothetical protein